MRWELLGSATTAIAFAIACGSTSGFTCQDDAQCDGGVCQEIGACSFPDADCVSGQRFGEHSPTGLAGQCVDVAGTSTTTDSTTTTSSSPTTSDPPLDTSSGDPTPPGDMGTTSETSTTGEPLDPELLLWLRFEDLPGLITTDSSTYGFEATCIEGQCPMPTAGPFGTAALFDGANDALSVPFDPLFELPGAFTAAVWVRVDELAGIRRMVFGHPFGESSDDSWLILFIPALDPDPDWEVGFSMNSTGNSTQVADLTFGLGEWVHLAATYDGETMSFFVGGEQLFSGPAPTPLFDDHPLTIGYDINGGIPVGHFHGALDEVRLYGRALPPEEVAILASR